MEFLYRISRVFVRIHQQFANLGRWLVYQRSWKFKVTFFFGLAFLLWTIGLGNVEMDVSVFDQSEIDLYSCFSSLITPLLADLHENSKIQREKDLTGHFFGGLPREVALLYRVTNVSSSKYQSCDHLLPLCVCHDKPLVLHIMSSHASYPVSYQALQALLTPIFKLDETSSCAKLDGVASTLPIACQAEPYASSSLYCTCTASASSPNQLATSVDTPLVALLAMSVAQSSTSSHSCCSITRAQSCCMRRICASSRRSLCPCDQARCVRCPCLLYADGVMLISALETIYTSI